MAFMQSRETQITTVKWTNAGGQTKRANERSFVYRPPAWRRWRNAKTTYGNFDLFTKLFAEVPYFCFIVNSCSYMTCTIQGILPSFQDPFSTTKNLPVFFFRVLCHCFTLEENCMYIYLDILTVVISPKEGGWGFKPHKLYIKNVFLAH